MATPKTYVHVAKFDVGKLFDAKYKSKTQDLMRKLAIKYIEKSKLLTTKGDKKQEGFVVGGTLTKLLKGEKDGKTLLAAEASLYLGTWPKKSMFGFAPGSKAAAEVMNPDKMEAEIAYLLDPLFESLMKKSVKEFETRAKAKAKAR